MTDFPGYEALKIDPGEPWADIIARADTDEYPLVPGNYPRWFLLAADRPVGEPGEEKQAAEQAPYISGSKKDPSPWVRCGTCSLSYRLPSWRESGWCPICSRPGLARRNSSRT